MQEIPEEKLVSIIDRHAAIEQELSTIAGGGEAYVRLTREYAQLSPVAKVVGEYREVCHELVDLEELLADPDTDTEMRELAVAEQAETQERLSQLDSELRVQLLPKDEADERNAILEIRAGTGGEEAGLFALELFRMYQK